MYKGRTTSLIIAAAGKGERAKQNKNKLLVPVLGKTCLERTLSVFCNTNFFDQIIIVCSKDDKKEISALLNDKDVTLVLGGDTRTQSVKNALKKVDTELVLIHDGARPFVSKEIITDCLDTTIKYGSAITAIASRDTMFEVKDGVVTDYLGKDKLYSVQTPQGFNSANIKRAYACAGEETFNDDGEVYKKFIGDVYLSKGDEKNIKITYPEDMLKLGNKEVKIGCGFDCHKLVENRKLVLGGIEIEHTKGLLGHSDADVLTHAIMDAILSALSLRDIGYHFPDADQKYKDADSIKLLEHVLTLIKEKGYKVGNISAVIMAEKPKLKNHIPTITQNLANVLDVTVDCVGITATTLEGLGFVGREEGICVQATALLKEI